MNKNIYYIDMYKDSKKKKNMGFARVDGKKLFVLLRGVTAPNGICCKVYLHSKTGDKSLMMSIDIENGYGQASCNWQKYVESLSGKELYIPLMNDGYGRCMFDIENGENKMTDSSFILKTSAIEKTDRIERIPDEPEKWKQIYKTYQQVHIYPEAQTVMIRPKDMVLLTSKYHDLSVNSFVLHSYYNYKQLLLFRYGNENEYTYYLGVPGVYYERERRIALLFGFEGFENGEARLEEEKKRKAYVGCFGYYMKQVDI